MLTAMAVARMWEPTEFTSAVLSGEVFSRSRNAATAMAGTIHGPLIEQSEDHHRHAQPHADCGDEVIRTFHPRQQVVAKPASGQRRQNAIDHHDLAEDQVGRFQAVAACA